MRSSEFKHGHLGCFKICRTSDCSFVHECVLYILLCHQACFKLLERSHEPAKSGEAKRFAYCRELLNVAGILAFVQQSRKITIRGKQKTLYADYTRTIRGAPENKHLQNTAPRGDKSKVILGKQNFSPHTAPHQMASPLIWPVWAQNIIRELYADPLPRTAFKNERFGLRLGRGFAVGWVKGIKGNRRKSKGNPKEIKGNRRKTEETKGNQKEIKGSQRKSKEIQRKSKGNPKEIQRNSKEIKGNQRKSKGNQKEIKRESKGNQRKSKEIKSKSKGNQRKSNESKGHQKEIRRLFNTPLTQNRYFSKPPRPKGMPFSHPDHVEPFCSMTFSHPSHTESLLSKASKIHGGDFLAPLSLRIALRHYFFAPLSHRIATFILPGPGGKSWKWKVV